MQEDKKKITCLCKYWGSKNVLWYEKILTITHWEER